MPACPICGRQFPPRSLNAHVNTCLDRSANTAPANADNAAAPTDPPSHHRILAPDVRLSRLRGLLSLPFLHSRLSDRTNRPSGILYIKISTVTLPPDIPSLIGCNLRVCVRFQCAEHWSPVVSVPSDSTVARFGFECALEVPTYFAESKISITLHKCGWLGSKIVVAQAHFPLRATISAHARNSYDMTAPEHRRSSMGMMQRQLQQSMRASLLASIVSGGIAPTNQIWEDEKVDDVDGSPLRAARPGATVPAHRHGSYAQHGPLQLEMQQSPAGYTAKLVSPHYDLGVQRISRTVPVESRMVPKRPSFLAPFLHSDTFSHKCETADNPALTSAVSFNMEGLYICVEDVQCSERAESCDLSPLHRAAADGNVFVVSAILRCCGVEWAYLRTPAAAAIDDGRLSVGGLTALDVACLCRRKAVVEYLLRIAPVSSRVSPGFGFHALHYAVLGSDADIVRAVCRRFMQGERDTIAQLRHVIPDIELDPLSSYDRWVRDWAKDAALWQHNIYQSQLSKRSGGKSPHTWFETIFYCGSPTHEFRDVDFTAHPVLATVPASSCRALATTLRVQPSDWSMADITDVFGNTPLMLAAAMGQMEVVEIFMEHSACRHILSASGNTCLTFALSSNFTDVAMLLLLQGVAIPHLASAIKSDAIEVSTQCNVVVECGKQRTHVHVLDQVATRECLINLDKRGGGSSFSPSMLHKVMAACTPSAQLPCGRTALHLAVSCCNESNKSSVLSGSRLRYCYDILQLLVEAGCRRCCSTTTLESPLMRTVLANDSRATKILCLLSDSKSWNSFRRLVESTDWDDEDVHHILSSFSWISPKPSDELRFGDDGRGRIFSRFAYPVSVEKDLQRLKETFDADSTRPNQAYTLLQDIVSLHKRFFLPLYSAVEDAPASADRESPRPPD